MAAPVIFRSGDVEASPQQAPVDRTVTTGPQRRPSATTAAESSNLLFTDSQQAVRGLRITAGIQPLRFSPGTALAVDVVLANRRPPTFDVPAGIQPPRFSAGTGIVADVVLGSRPQPRFDAPVSGNQPPVNDALIADQGQPVASLVLSRPPQPLPALPDIRPPERRFVPITEPNLVFVDAEQSVSRLRPPAVSQPLMSNVGPALSPSTPVEVVLPSHPQPLPSTATSANQPLADSTIAASAPTPTGFDYTWRGPGAQPVPDIATAGKQPIFDATLPAVSPTPPSFDFVWRTVPMPVLEPPRTGPQPLPNEAALVQPSGDLASSRTVVIVIPPPQPWWRQQPAAGIVQGQPASAAFVLRMLFQPIPLPVGSADQPRTSPFAAVVSPSGPDGDIAFTESMVVVVAAAPAPAQQRPGAAVVADQGQVVVPVIPAAPRPAVPGATVTGAQPLPDSVLAAAFPTPPEFPFTWHGPGKQPNPGIPVTGDQPIFDAAIAAAFPTPQPFDYTWRGPGAQPVPGPAVAGRQPSFILAAWYGEAKELQFSWRAWFQPPPGLPSSGTQPQVVVSVYAAVAQPFFYMPPPRPQPLPDPATAGAQPLARVAWFLQAVLLHFAWRPWPQPVPGVAVSGPQPLMFRGVATTLFRRLVELVAQRRYFRRLNTRYTVSYTSRWTAERRYFRREDS